MKPKTLYEIFRDKSKPGPRRKTRSINVRVDDPTADKLEAFAHALGRPKSWVVATLIDIVTLEHLRSKT